MVEIASIVEGHGEVVALPILIRRIAARVAPSVQVRIPLPVRVPRQKVVLPGNLERAVQNAARLTNRQGRILILLDSDRDCPKTLADQLLKRAQAARGDRRIKIVLAKMEYEAWFIASASSLAGHCEIDPETKAVHHAESIRNAKAWLSKRMPPYRGYDPRRDQPRLTKVFDLDAARSASSFDKLWRDVQAILID